MHRSEPRVVVVGAGIGGLASAVHLALAGCRVRMFEQALRVGGKVRAVDVAGQAVAAGPTVLTMPWVFDELFDAAGASFRQQVHLERAELVARHSWTDGTRLDLHADRARSAEAIGQAFGAGEARAYLAFCEETRRIFETVEHPFLRAQRPTLASLVDHARAEGVRALASIDALRSMWRVLERRFADPRLRQLFGRYATYCGSSPFEAPGTLNLVAHVEAEGVYRVAGGLPTVARALADLAAMLGVEVSCGCAVDRIVVEGGRAVGVSRDGSFHPADAVVFNGDVSALGGGLLGSAVERAAPASSVNDRSLSAVTWSVVGRARGFPLVHHNVFFSADYAGEFDALRKRRAMPGEPTVYVCAEDRGDAATSDGDERFLVLVNAPATGDVAGAWGEAAVERCGGATWNMLARHGLALEANEQVVTTPKTFHRLFPATGGALYGPAARGALSPFSRAGAASKVPRLYLAGGSVHPGAGVPMAALSGKLAAACVLRDLGSIARSLPVAIGGTTSMA
jgi:1-hydroxycarotenoid 3,4-desaturase